MDFASIVDWFSQESMNAAEQTNEPKRRESRGLGRPHIAAAIDSAFIELGGITRSRIVDELGAIAFANPRGPDWMPITPKTGSLFHAETQPTSARS
jgi:hypothetical protein